MKRLALLWLACGLASISSAQEPAAPTLPPGPLLNRAPDFAQWTITSKAAAADTDAETPKAEPSPSATVARRHRKSGESEEKKSATPAEQTTIVTKTQSIRHEETGTGGNAKVQRWCVPDMQVTVDGDAAPVVLLPGNDPDTDYVDYSKTDFPEFEWIAKRHFTDVKKVMGQECLIFEDKSVPRKGDSTQTPPPTMVASINAATRLPVELRTGDETRTYEFGLAPTAMLTLPPEVAAVVAQWRKTMDQAALMPAKP